MIKYDHDLDTMVYNTTTYSLKKYRKWLLGNYPDLCKNHFIKAITIGGSTKFTFDWQNIYNTSERYKYLNNFLNEQETR